MKFAVVVSLALLVASCAAVSPVAVRAGDQCFRCRQIIAQPEFAGEIIDVNGNVLKFRTAGCMAQYINEHQGSFKAIFVTDHASGRMLRASTATFVNAEIDPKTRARDYIAFRSVDDALALARKEKESVIDWPGLVTRVGNTKGD